MLHDIPATDLAVGMFVVGFDRPWIEVPFWRRRFLVSDAETLQRILDSGIARVTVDDVHGRRPARAATEPPLFEAPIHAAPAVERRRARRPARVDEVTLAREAVERSKQAVARMFDEVRLGRAVAMEQVAPVVDEIAGCVSRDAAAILSVTRLKSVSEYTYLHSIAVSALMVTFARHLNLEEVEVRQAGLAGLLHDIGKAGVPQRILHKTGPLDPEERRLIEAHPEEGHRLLSRNGNVSASVLDVCLHHHERMDGGGYPLGLTGDRLSLFVRMATICDVYDALTSHRSYRAGATPADALCQMASWAGHMDERLLRSFVAAIGIYPLGALVRLCSNRLGLVLRDDPARPATPMVRVFYAVEQGRAVPLMDVEAAGGTGSGSGGDAILQMEVPDQWFAEDWASLSDRLRHAEPGDRPVVAMRGLAMHGAG